jgi:uncharacterized damage-inducible protein DinB
MSTEACSCLATSLGLLHHAAEHATRHTGQVVTTALIVRSRS